MTPSEKFVKQTVEFVQTGKRADFRTKQQRRYDLYTGHYVPHILDRLKSLCPETWDQFQPLWIDIYRKTIDRRAGVLYKDPPTRTYVDASGQKVTPAVQAAIDRMLPPRRFDRTMDKAARYLEMHRTIAVAPVWRHAKIACDVLAPMNFDVAPGYPDPADVDDADAVIHLRGDTFVVWTRHDDTVSGRDPSYFVADKKGRIVDSGDNPYFEPGKGAQYPFAVLQVEDPDTAIFIPGGEEIVEAALHVAFTLTDDAFIQRFQSFGQPVFRGVTNEVAKTLVLSPSEGIGLPDPAMDLEFKSPGNTPEQRMIALQNFLTVFANSVDLPADIFLPHSNIPESGVAKRIASVPLTEYRQRFARRMAHHEAEVFEAVRLIHNTHAAPADRIPWDVELLTEHAPIGLFFDALEQDTRTAERVTHDLETWQDVIARERGVSPAEAARILQRNRALNAAAKAPAPGVAPVPGMPETPVGMSPIGQELRDRMEQRRRERQIAIEAAATAENGGKT